MSGGWWDWEYKTSCEACTTHTLVGVGVGEREREREWERERECARARAHIHTHSTKTKVLNAKFSPPPLPPPQRMCVNVRTCVRPSVRPCVCLRPCVWLCECECVYVVVRARARMHGRRRRGKGEVRRGSLSAEDKHQTCLQARWSASRVRGGNEQHRPAAVLFCTQSQPSMQVIQAP